ncbi:hypothetical protein CA260_08820 [Dyella jiangningensis]|uniref:Uncharacterized protein n=1 Tax=Dyella jiangningensis TaxID=1379159 RepID=A0A328PBE5_9GAMM|nr:hypothetical protein CA260_08820 [Dyella jiangningensis]
MLLALLCLATHAMALPHRPHAATAAAKPAKHAAPSAPADTTPEQRIVVHRNVGNGVEVRVSVGIPFPPGMLRDAGLVRILDAKGEEVPSHVQATLRWYARDHSIRAVRAQFHAPLQDNEATYYFAVGKPRTREADGWPYVDERVADAQGVKVAAALATLEPSWLCESLIAGPQVPASQDEAYARYVSTQFDWARKLPADDHTAWLFDRPSTLFKAYVRTGRFDYLQAADQSYHFYMRYMKREGLPISPFCAGGWTYGKEPCDVKYVYIEPSLLALALTGDDSEYDAALVDKMVTLWQHGGWSGTPGPYTSPGERFTERLAGLGLLATVNAYELTGDLRYLRYTRERVDWLYDHQRANPDKLGDDGSWRNSWNLHEDDSWQPEKDVRGSSPWMSENIIDGLWHTWLVTGDPRIPTMIIAFGRYMERYGWIDVKAIKSGRDWRNPCSGPQGQIAWYWSSSRASFARLADIEDSDGWYSDAHNVELVMPVAAAYYFETDPAQSEALKQRLDALKSSYSTECAEVSGTTRRFNWNNRGAGVAMWFLQQPAGSGATSSMAGHAMP